MTFRHIQSAAARGVLIWFGLTACGHPPLKFESEHFRVYAEAELCPERLDWLEHSYDSISTFLGVEIPEGQKIDYFLYSSIEDSEESCGWIGGGPRCATSSSVRTDEPVHYHELVHALALHWGRAPRMFEEGLAEVIGCDGSAANESSAPTVEAAAWLVDDGFWQGSPDERFARYGEAQAFVHFLMERYGTEEFLALYRDLDTDSDRERVDTAFRDRLGVPLDLAVQAWVDEGPTTRLASCYPVPVCRAPPLSETPENVALTCGPAIDPLIPDLGAIRSLRIEDDRAAVIHIASDRETEWAAVRPCAREMQRVHTIPGRGRQTYRELGFPLEGDRLLIAELDPGEYAVELRAAETTDMEVSASRLIVGEECSSAEPLAIEPDIGEISVFVRADAGMRWLALRPAAAMRLRVVWPQTEDRRPLATSVELCAAGCGSCTPVDGSLPVDLSAGDVHLGIAPGAGIERASVILTFEPSP
jgi:hypothetical protein